MDLAIRFDNLCRSFQEACAVLDFLTDFNRSVRGSVPNFFLTQVRQFEVLGDLFQEGSRMAQTLELTPSQREDWRRVVAWAKQRKITEE